MDHRRSEVHFTGTVQGVGFRATAVSIAQQYDVAGWVRNEPDGSVQCIVEGAPGEVDRFLAALQQRMAGYIERMNVNAADATGEFFDFSIR